MCEFISEYEDSKLSKRGTNKLIDEEEPELEKIEVDLYCIL
ncbi:MAG TPA: hypothetical protein VFR94_21890 [Nitrososphaeraceae archaeon]|nr:hypothetical protein [Nitrososphaeraceae archaeon]